MEVAVIAKGHQLVPGDTVCSGGRHNSLCPVLGVVGVEGQVVGDVGAVVSQGHNGPDVVRHDAGVHTAHDGVIVPADVHIVAHHLVPLDDSPAGVGPGIQSDGVIVEVVHGGGAGSAPAGILEQEDVVAVNGNLLRLAQGHSGSLH